MKTETRLEQFFSKQKHKDPMLPAVMHALKRYLSGAQNTNKFDKIVQDNMRKHQISRMTIESMVKNWDAIDSKKKEHWFSKGLIGLDQRKPIDLKMFSSAVRDAAANYGSSSRGIPLPRKLPVGITPPPRITEVRTAGLDFVLVLRPGGEFTLIGRNFSAVAAENRIQIGRVRAGTGTVELDVLHELTPTSAMTTQLRGIAPLELTPGDYNVRVITNRSRSNLWSAYVETPPAPAAVLDSIDPGTCQYPGERVLIRGDNFVADSLVGLEFLDAEPIGSDIRAGYRDYRVGAPMVDFRNRNEIFFTIPQETWPGAYAISIVNPHAPSSLHRSFNVCTPQYTVELESIFCRDESDWEHGFLVGDDEIVIGSSASVDNGAFSDETATAEFEGFSDGTRRSFRGVQLFSNAGASVPVNYTLDFMYLMLESNGYDKEEVKSLVRALGAIADDALLIVGPLVGIGVVTMGILGAAIGLVVGVAIVAVMLHSMAPDIIGGQIDRFTAQQLQLRTASGGGSFSQTVSFLNHDDDGSYDMTYKIVRSR